MTAGTDDLQVNHILDIYTMFLDGKPVMHLVNHATHFYYSYLLEETDSCRDMECCYKLLDERTFRNPGFCTC